VSLDISPAPYNATKDGAQDVVDGSLDGQDAAWERKRGTQEYEDWLQAEMKKVDVAAVMGLFGDKPGGSIIIASSKGSGAPQRNTGTASSSGRRLKMSV
jgi:hypothetical protein